MQISYIFQDLVQDENLKHKFIIVKQTSKYKYILELHKKTIDQIQDINDIKLGCFLYLKNNKFCIYDAKNYRFKEFNELSEFIIEENYYMDITYALRDLFNKKY